MGISIKGACFTIGGIAGIWLVHKLANVSERIIYTITDARKWHAYYKYAGDKAYSVPPGYASVTIPHENYDVKITSPEQYKEEKKEQNKTKSDVDISGIVNAISEVTKTFLSKKINNSCTKDIEKANETEDVNDAKIPTAEESKEKFNNITDLFANGEFVEKSEYEDEDNNEEGENE
jgi:hypothetical protein